VIAVDDGIVNGNITAADLFFLLALILAVIAAALAFPRTNPPARNYSPFVGWLAVGSLALGWFVL